MTATGGTPREARPIILQRICERFTRAFDSREVFNAQDECGRIDKLSQDEISKHLATAEYVREVTPPEEHRRAKYEFREEYRLPEQVSIAVNPRRCAKCGRDIHRGERVYSPLRPYAGDGTRRRWMCRDCGLAELRDMYLALEGQPKP